MDIPDRYEFKLSGGRTIEMRIPTGTAANELLTLLDSLSVFAAKAKEEGRQSRTDLSRHVLDSAPTMLPKLAVGMEDAGEDECRRMAAFIGVNGLMQMYRRCAGAHEGTADLLSA